MNTVKKSQYEIQNNYGDAIYLFRLTYAFMSNITNTYKPVLYDLLYNDISVEEFKNFLVEKSLDNYICVSKNLGEELNNSMLYDIFKSDYNTNVLNVFKIKKTSCFMYNDVINHSIKYKDCKFTSFKLFFYLGINDLITKKILNRFGVNTEFIDFNYYEYMIENIINFILSNDSYFTTKEFKDIEKRYYNYTDSDIIYIHEDKFDNIIEDSSIHYNIKDVNILVYDKDENVKVLVEEKNIDNICEHLNSSCTYTSLYNRFLLFRETLLSFLRYNNILDDFNYLFIDCKKEDVDKTIFNKKNVNGNYGNNDNSAKFLMPKNFNDVIINFSI
jgi:hypothetical protein